MNGGGDAIAAIGFLVGDVNNSRTVSANDLQQMKALSGQGVDATNFRFDLNTSGAIGAADIVAVKSRSPRTLAEVTVPVVFTTQPANAAITVGQSAQFTVVVSGAPAPSLQWQLSTDGGANWSNIAGETNSAFSVVAAALTDSGRQFRVVATNGAGAVNSNAAILTVNAPTKALIGPAGGTVNGFYGAQIVVPAGALVGTVEISLVRDSTNSPAFALADVDAVGATYELMPHGTAFSLPVTLRIPFDPAQLPNDAIPVLYKVETAGTFVALPTIVNGNFLETTVVTFSWIIPGYAATKPRAVYALQAAGTFTAAGVASYRINATTGALTGPTSTALTGDGPASVVAHPSRRFMYVTNAGSTTVNNISPNSVATYQLNTLNGQIVGAAQGSVSTGAPAGYRTTMPAIHPSGKFLYAMNFDVASINPVGFISLFTINGTTGTLTLSASVTSGNGAQPMGIAFNRFGTLAYVLYAGSSSTNSFSTQVKVYSVNAATGVLTGPSSGVAAGVLGCGAWSIAVDPNDKFAYTACLSTDEVRAYSINSASGALTFIGSVITASKPSSLAIDSQGRFLYVGRQTPFLNINVQAYRIDATTGALTLCNGVLISCIGGACTGPTPVVADPQGQFVFANDVGQGLSSFKVDATSGALTPAGNVTSVYVPWTGGVGFPFTFGVTGTSPIWQNNCTQSCALTSSGGGGGGGGSNPNPPTSHYLTVTQGAYVGYVDSTPAGIDIAPATIINPIPKNDFRAAFPVSSSVTLCTNPPPQPFSAYDVEWTGSCSGTGICTSVTMTSDKQCHLEFKPVIGR